MKIKLLFFVSLISFIVASCNSDPRPLGLWDKIVVDKTSVSVNAEGGKVVFNMENYESWRIAGTELNGVIEHGSLDDSYALVETDQYVVQVPETDSKQVIIDVEKNNSGIVRQIKVDMTVGNAFVRLYITQEK